VWLLQLWRAERSARLLSRAPPQHMAADHAMWRVAAACALAATLVFLNTFTASFVYDDK
jgi:hypothetical protein